MLLLQFLVLPEDDLIVAGMHLLLLAVISVVRIEHSPFVPMIRLHSSQFPGHSRTGILGVVIALLRVLILSLSSDNHWLLIDEVSVIVLFVILSNILFVVGFLQLCSHSYNV